MPSIAPETAVSTETVDTVDNADNVETAEQSFDVVGKGRGWHTAFYYLAEHVRLMTDGAVNHKALYALVGTDGRYFNHDNPLVRKRTAGALSRVVHSARYAQEMRTAYTRDAGIFRRAALEVCAQVGYARSYDDADTLRYICEKLWPDVRRGLENEKQEWRAELDLFRIDQEISALFANGARTSELAMYDDASVASLTLAGIFHVVAFGHLDFLFARQLVDEVPTGVLSPEVEIEQGTPGACLVKFVDPERSAFVDMWTVPYDRPLRVGRYTDCDVVEGDPGLSRLHCYIYRKGGVWYFEDVGSSNGSRVVRNGEDVYDTKEDGAHLPFPLQFGDMVILAERACYWFGAMKSQV